MNDEHKVLITDQDNYHNGDNSADMTGQIAFDQEPNSGRSGKSNGLVPPGISIESLAEDKNEGNSDS